MKRISHKAFFTAASLATASTLCLALSAALWKYLTTLSALSITLFIRFFIPFIIVGVFMGVARIKLKTKSIHHLLIRSIFVFIAQYALLYVIARSNLLKATLLYSTSGLFLPVIMYLFLKVKATKQALISIIVSFIGIAIALGSWEDLIEPTSLLGLASGLFTAFAQMIQHRASKSDHPMSINFYLYGFCSVFTLVIASITPAFWQQSLSFFSHIAFTTACVVLLFSVLSISNQYLKNLAFKYVNKASSLVPFLYMTIIFSGVIDWIWLGLIPSLRTRIGCLVVILGGVIMSSRKLKA